MNKLDMDMTPAEKAQRTKAMNKIWADHDKRTQPTDDAFYAFAKTLYPERDRVIDKAEAERDRVIAEAEAKCEAIRDFEMAKFDKTMEVLEAERTLVRHASLQIVKAETAKYTEAN
jgi:hypothetical protein